VREICEFFATQERTVGFIGLPTRKNVPAEKFYGKADNRRAHPQRYSSNSQICCMHNNVTHHEYVSEIIVVNNQGNQE